MAKLQHRAGDILRTTLSGAREFATVVLALLGVLACLALLVAPGLVAATQDDLLYLLAYVPLTLLMFYWIGEGSA